MDHYFVGDTPPKVEKTLAHKLQRLAFLLPLATSLLGASIFIVGTIFTFHPEKGMISSGSPASAAWQGLLLFLYSLIAVAHLATKPQTALSNFFVFRIATYGFLILMAVQALVSIATGVFFLTLVSIEIFAGILALTTGLI